MFMNVQMVHECSDVQMSECNAAKPGQTKHSKLQRGAQALVSLLPTWRRPDRHEAQALLQVACRDGFCRVERQRHRRPGQHQDAIVAKAAGQRRIARDARRNRLSVHLEGHLLLRCLRKRV